MDIFTIIFLISLAILVAFLTQLLLNHNNDKVLFKVNGKKVRLSIVSSYWIGKYEIGSRKWNIFLHSKINAIAIYYDGKSFEIKEHNFSEQPQFTKQGLKKLKEYIAD